MSAKEHREFEEWLGRLPRRQPSPRFSRHMENCDKCRLLYHDLDPVAAALNSLKDPAKLSKRKLAELAHHAREARVSQRKRLMAWKVCLVSLASLPFVAGINWLAATAGYGALAFISPALAKFFLVSFCLTAAILTGMAYAAVPLVIGWFQTRKVRETVT